MSKYTTEVRFICETAAGLTESVGGDSVNSIVQKAAPVIFNFPFPIFDENYRNVLEQKILKHYYTREIAFETSGLWKLKLDTKLNEIMPFYNQLYKSTLLEFNPFYDVELNREHSVKNNGTQESNGTDKQKSVSSDTASRESLNAYSETPQGGIAGLENYNYLTNATKNTGNETAIGNTETTGESGNKVTAANTEEYLESVKGKQGTQSYSSLLSEYRETFLNIDMQIINELSDLFFNLW